MWANPWGTGPIQQSAFQGMPSDQVDWAALAKQWISQRENVPDHQQNQSQPPLPMGGAPPPPPPNNNTPVGDDMEIEGENEQNQQNNNNYGYTQQQGWTWGGIPNWNIATGWGMQMGEGKDPQSFDYGHQGNFPPAFDYNHGGDQFAFQQDGSGQGDYNQYNQWEDSEDSHHSRPFRNNHRGNRYMSPQPEEEEDSGIDAAKRKTLPLWIREGLEKMEREKQKKIEKERMEKEKVEAERQREEEERKLREEKESEDNDDQPHVPRKSRFDSDDEEDRRSVSPAPVREKSRSPEQVKKRSPSPQEFKSEEEKQVDLMMRVRKMLTEILLEVTNTEIEILCKEVFYKEKNRAAKGRNVKPLCQVQWHLMLCSIPEHNQSPNISIKVDYYKRT